MLGRAATRIELNRDSDLDELVEARKQFEIKLNYEKMQQDQIKIPQIRAT